MNADGASNPTLQKAANPFCSLITRNEVTVTQRHEGAVLQHGLVGDLGRRRYVELVDYVGPGTLNVNTVATHLFKYETQQNPTLRSTTPSGRSIREGQFDYRLMSSLNYAFSGGRESRRDLALSAVDQGRNGGAGS